MNIILIYFAVKYNGDWDKIYQALEEKEKVSIDEIRKLENKIKEESWNVITILDLNYPQQLKDAYKPPFVIWIKGDTTLLNTKLICVTGNQLYHGTETIIKKSIPKLEKKYNIVFAGFSGVDDFIAKTIKKPTICISSCGLDKTQLKNIGLNHLIISEYPFGVETDKDKLRARNRLIAAFSSSLVLFSSKKDGGMNHLVSEFLNLGKEIYCFPGDGLEEDGNSDLIKQGATFVTDVEDMY